MTPRRPRISGNTLHRIVILGVLGSIPMWVVGESLFPQATASEWHRFPSAASALWLIIWLIGMLRVRNTLESNIAGAFAILFFVATVIFTPL